MNIDCECDKGFTFTFEAFVRLIQSSVVMDVAIMGLLDAALIPPPMALAGRMTQ